MPTKITAVFHLAYDWRLAREAIARIAPHVDQVLIVVDRDSKTWTLRDYPPVPVDELIAAVSQRQVSVAHIKVLRYPFHMEHYAGTAMQRLRALPHYAKMSPSLRRETLQRNWASLEVEPGHWILQLDGDEWVAEPKLFCAWLRQQRADATVSAPWLNVWKRVSSGYLIVDPTTNPPGSRARVATARRGDLRVSRAPSRGAEVHAPFSLLHWTLAGRGGRTGLEQKLKGWGLMSEADADLFLDAWEKVDESNYRCMDWITPSRKPGYGSQRLTLVSPEFLVDRFAFKPELEAQL